MLQGSKMGHLSSRKLRTT